MKKVSLSDHFDGKKIFRMVISPILMMVFTSLYSVVDGIFVSRFAPNGSFAGINLIYPLIMVIGGIGFIFGTGGSALVSKLLGQQKREEASETFSLLVATVVIIGITASIVGVFLVKPMAKAMVAFSTSKTDGMVKYAIRYGRILMLGQAFFMLENVFQSFFVVNEQPRLGFYFNLAAGAMNMVLDAVLVGWLRLGVEGAAIATIIGYLIGGLGPIVYFLTHKGGLIRLRPFRVDFRSVGQAALNGMSEFINNVSSSSVSIVYNFQLIALYGENGVATYGCFM